jgi:hypothetical protein
MYQVHTIRVIVLNAITSLGRSLVSARKTRVSFPMISKLPSGSNRKEGTSMGTGYWDKYLENYDSEHLPVYCKENYCDSLAPSPAPTRDERPEFV